MHILTGSGYIQNKLAQAIFRINWLRLYSKQYIPVFKIIQLYLEEHARTESVRIATRPRRRRAPRPCGAPWDACAGRVEHQFPSVRLRVEQHAVAHGRMRRMDDARVVHGICNCACSWMCAGGQCLPAGLVGLPAQRRRDDRVGGSPEAAQRIFSASPRSVAAAGTREPLEGVADERGCERVHKHAQRFVVVEYTRVPSSTSACPRIRVVVVVESTAWLGVSSVAGRAGSCCTAAVSWRFALQIWLAERMPKLWHRKK
ncbi:hypothetical protein DFH11DRAFT_1550882 [Phellopilus nigrolimitatus]|nr:hypothetical protein DFH11DRAFT_1550882 [Phellopilus nigrolimitatus]